MLSWFSLFTSVNVRILTHIRRNEYFLHIVLNLLLANYPTFDAAWSLLMEASFYKRIKKN